MYRRYKGSKGTEKKTPGCTFYFINCDEYTYRAKIAEKGYITFYSTDPAAKHYALRIEKRTLSKMEPIVWDVRNLNIGTGNLSIYENFTSYMNEYEEEILDADIFIIERQPPLNYTTVRLSQHNLSYLQIKLSGVNKRPRVIVEIDPNHTRSVLGIPARNKKPKQVKTLSIQEYMKTLLNYGDEWSISILEKQGKKDYLVDTGNQIEAFCRETEILNFFIFSA